MKFGKTYSEYIEKEAQNRLAGCSYVEFKRLKKVLKKCPFHDTTTMSAAAADGTHVMMQQQSSCSSSPQTHPCSRQDSPACTTSGLIKAAAVPHSKKSTKAAPLALTTAPCPSSCPGCDAKFFGELMAELAEVVGCFNTRAQQLLKLHMATGLRKYFLRRKCKMDLNREAMIQEGQTLVSYASMNALAVRKILKKYDKVHSTREGGIFQSRLLAMRGELLKSPYLVELGALHLNLADAEQNVSPTTDVIGEFSCDLESASPTLTCAILDSAKVDFDLTCSICLETMFDAVALGCGHIFCNSCACTAASVLAHEGPKTASCSARCPLCRQAGVYVDAVRLKELSVLISTRCPEYWKERLQRERKQQLKLAKQCYDQQLEALMGLGNSVRAL